MDFDYSLRELYKEWEQAYDQRKLFDETIPEFLNFWGDEMTFYIEFKDGTEYVICADTKREAEFNAKDMQRQAKKSTIISQSKKVADK